MKSSLGLVNKLVSKYTQLITPVRSRLFEGTDGRRNILGGMGFNQFLVEICMSAKAQVMRVVD